jgi:hypothetical protein
MITPNIKKRMKSSSQMTHSVISSKMITPDIVHSDCIAQLRRTIPGLRISVRNCGIYQLRNATGIFVNSSPVDFLHYSAED